MDSLNDSILVSVKKMLGLEDEYTPFDTDIMIDINAALMKLTQLGVGPKEGFQVTDYNNSWSEFITNDVLLGGVKTYVYLQVKMLFDPPTNSFVMDAMQRQADEIGWRLNVQAESVETFDWMDDDKPGGGSGGCHPHHRPRTRIEIGFDPEEQTIEFDFVKKEKT